MIPARQIIEEQQQDLSIPGSYTNAMLRWIHDAIQTIGVYPDATGLSICRLPICDQVIEKPKGMIKPYRLFLLSSENYIREAHVVGHGLIRHKMDNWFSFTNQPSTNKFDVWDQGSVWTLQNNTTTFNEAVVEYFGVPYDEDTEEPLVPENYRIAVVAYIEWQWEKQLRKRDRTAVRLDDINDKKIEFLRQARIAVTKSVMPDMTQLEERARKMWAPRFKAPRPSLS